MNKTKLVVLITMAVTFAILCLGITCEAGTYEGKVNPFEFTDQSKWTQVAARPCYNGGRPHMHVLLENVDETATIKLVEIVVFPVSAQGGIMVGYRYEEEGVLHQFSADGKGNYVEVEEKKEEKKKPEAKKVHV